MKFTKWQPKVQAPAAAPSVAAGRLRVVDHERTRLRLKAYELALLRRTEREPDDSVVARADRIFVWAAGDTVTGDASRAVPDAAGG